MPINSCVFNYLPAVGRHPVRPGEYGRVIYRAYAGGVGASYRRSVGRLWGRLRNTNPLVVDAIFAVIVLIAGLLSLTAEPTPDHPTPTDALAVILVVVGFGAIAFRRRFPIAVLGVATLATIVYVVRDYPDNGLPVMALIALYTVASLRTRPVWVAAVIVYLGLLSISVITHPEELSLGDFVGNVAIFGIAAVFGDSVRLRRAYTATLEARAADLERNQHTEAQRAVAEERLRIARELHDVVAHAMSVVAVQSGVGAHVIDTDPAEAKRILENVKVTSREALDEMRRLLGVLRQQEGDADGPSAVAPATGTGMAAALAPVPGLDGVESLAQGVREAGVPVTVSVTGVRTDVPPGVDLCAFRIVQEALTNVLKHAGPARAEVGVDYRPDSVTVVVRDDGRGASADRGPTSEGKGPGGGHGLLGMRERVAVFGGELSTGPHVGGGFRVAATLPFVPAATAASSVGTTSPAPAGPAPPPSAPPPSAPPPSAPGSAPAPSAPPPSAPAPSAPGSASTAPAPPGSAPSGSAPAPSAPAPSAPAPSASSGSTPSAAGGGTGR